MIHFAEDDGEAAASNTTKPLRGKTVVVTGATSRIGAALTRQLVELGATVIAVGRSSERLQNLQTAVSISNIIISSSSSHRREVVPIQADFSDFNQVADAANDIRARFQSIDMIVANAGLHVSGWLRESSPMRTAQGCYETIFGVNYLSQCCSRRS